MWSSVDRCDPTGPGLTFSPLSGRCSWMCPLPWGLLVQWCSWYLCAKNHRVPGVWRATRGHSHCHLRLWGAGHHRCRGQTHGGKNFMTLLSHSYSQSFIFCFFQRWCLLCTSALLWWKPTMPCWASHCSSHWWWPSSAPSSSLESLKTGAAWPAK